MFGRHQIRSRQIGMGQNMIAADGTGRIQCHQNSITHPHPLTTSRIECRKLSGYPRLKSRYHLVALAALATQHYWLISRPASYPHRRMHSGSGVRGKSIGVQRFEHKKQRDFGANWHQSAKAPIPTSRMGA